MLESKFARAILSQLPVVAPHADIEAELLLSGQKPIGFVSLYPDDYRPVESDFGLLDEEATKKLRDNLNRVYYEIEMHARLDEQVAKGNLKSVDVLYKNPDGSPLVNRFYCQPEREDEMKFIAMIHQKKADHEPLTKSEHDHFAKKDMGLHLGYRKRDVMLFSLTQGGPMSRFIPDAAIIALRNIGGRFGHPALQETLIEKAREKCQEKGISLKTQIPKPKSY